MTPADRQPDYHHLQARQRAVTCPTCRREAQFLSATIRPVAQAAAARLPAEVELRRVHDRVPGQPLGDHAHYGVFYHGLGQEPPSGWEADDRGSWNLGTLRCPNCGLTRRHWLSWPDEAFYQLEFDGAHLWLDDRAQVSHLIALLEADDPRDLPGFWWFNNRLPSAFKTVKARRTLPARLRKIIA